MHALAKVCFLIIWPLEKILPLEKLPEIAVIIIFVVIYFMVEFIVIVMNVFSAYTGMSHFIVGMTLMVWGSDNMELLNAAVAIAKGEEEIGTVALMTCQVLCLTLVIPVAALSRMMSHEQKEIQLL